MMRKIILATILSLLASSTLGTGLANYFDVIAVRVDRSGYGFVKFDQPLGDTPASCINGHPSHLSFNTNTESGKAILSIVLTAYAAGKRVYARGTGACSEYGMVESWNFGWVLD